MYKVGIVGSSYSVGNHHNQETGENNLALPFETWLKKYVTETEFYNSASSGKGSELYLNKIVYLKDRFDIDILLMELINNRSELNKKSMSYDIENLNLEEEEKQVYHSSASIWKYIRGIDQDIPFETFSVDKDWKIWKQVQEQMAYSNNAFEFWGMLDCYQAIKLCNMLKIKVVTWQKSFDFRKYIEPTVKFEDHVNAHLYYESKYGKENILCDETHFNDKTNDEMVRDFIAPALKIAKQQVNLEGYSVGG